MTPHRTWQQVLAHLWLDAADARRLITPDGLQRLERAVHASESRHRGELRLCVEGGLHWAHVWRGVQTRDRAVQLFSALRVWDTAENNGVLIYLLLAERRIEVLADRGLNERVPSTVWDRLAQELSQCLQRGEFEQGLTQAIALVGTLMREHFPLPPGQMDTNELPDAVVLL